MKDYTQAKPDDRAAGLQGREVTIWHWLLGTGAVMMILGAAAILLPFVATLAIEVLLAVILVSAGVTQAVHAFKARHAKGFAFRLFGALMYGLVGVLLLTYPLHGVLTLTALLAILFMAVGAFKIALSLNLRPFPSWGWLMVSGLIAIVLGGLIWAGLPGTATWAIGLLVGIELLFSGWSMIVFGLSVRKDHEARSRQRDVTL
jgi:uncharacterized membrane protein HdeD (DUF308 family)